MIRIIENQPSGDVLPDKDVPPAPTKRAKLPSELVKPYTPIYENPNIEKIDGGAFVHMGKTGGSTISVLLRNGCHSYMQHPCRQVPKESPASLQIRKYYHVPDFGKLSSTRHDFYLWTVRDPLERTISAFTYEHLDNRDARHDPIDEVIRLKYVMAFECFPTLQAFVDYLDGYASTEFSYPYHKREVHSESCVDLARAALHGRVKLYHHLYFGYERLTKFLAHTVDIPLYVVRQEHLEEDWNTVNQYLAGDQRDYRIPMNHRRNVTSVNVPVTRDLNESGRRSLCRALTGEYEAYFALLKRAKNIQKEWSNSWERAQEQCGQHMDLLPLVPRR